MPRREQALPHLHLGCPASGLGDSNCVCSGRPAVLPPVTDPTPPPGKRGAPDPLPAPRSLLLAPRSPRYRYSQPGARPRNLAAAQCPDAPAAAAHGLGRRLLWTVGAVRPAPPTASGRGELEGNRPRGSLVWHRADTPKSHHAGGGGRAAQHFLRPHRLAGSSHVTRVSCDSAAAGKWVRECEA